MLAVGSTAPEFEATDSRGEKLRLSSLRGKKVVLYFFPKAFTAGCTIETRKFGEIAPELAARGVQVVGISGDSAETQARFAESCGAGFPIVSDPGHAIARSYGVLGMLMPKRVTFFLDERGVVTDVVEAMLPNPHLARARERFISP